MQTYRTPLPALPGGEEDGAHEDEAEDEHEVDHDRNHHQVRRHITFLSNLVKANPSGPEDNIPLYQGLIMMLNFNRTKDKDKDREIVS